MYLCVRFDVPFLNILLFIRYGLDTASHFVG